MNFPDELRRLAVVCRQPQAWPTLPPGLLQQALRQLEPIERGLQDLQGEPDEAIAGKMPDLCMDLLLTLADLEPFARRSAWSGARSTPSEYPPLAQILAAVGLIKNALIAAQPTQDEEQQPPAVPPSPLAQTEVQS